MFILSRYAKLTIKYFFAFFVNFQFLSHNRKKQKIIQNRIFTQKKLSHLDKLKNNT